MDIYDIVLECYKNAKRYEALRKLHPQQFTELYTRNIRNNEKFDDMIDKLIEKGG